MRAKKLWFARSLYVGESATGADSGKHDIERIQDGWLLLHRARGETFFVPDALVHAQLEPDAEADDADAGPPETAPARRGRASKHTPPIQG